MLSTMFIVSLSTFLLSIANAIPHPVDINGLSTICDSDKAPQVARVDDEGHITTVCCPLSANSAGWVPQSLKPHDYAPICCAESLGPVPWKTCSFGKAGLATIPASVSTCLNKGVPTKLHMYHNILVCENFTSPETKVTRDFTGESDSSTDSGVSPHDIWLGIGGNINVCPAGTSITDVISTDDWFIGACCPPSHPVGGETQRNSKVPVCCQGRPGHTGCGPKTGERIWPEWPMECATTYGWTPFERVDKINAGISPAMSHGCEWCRDARKQKCINGTGIFNRDVDEGGEEEPTVSVQGIQDADDTIDAGSGNTCPPTSKMVSVVDDYNRQIRACCPPSHPVGGESAHKSRVPVCCKGAKGKVGCPHEAGERVWPEHPVSCATGNEYEYHFFERVDEFNKKLGNGMGFGCAWCHDNFHQNCVNGTVPDPNVAADSQPAIKVIDYADLVERSEVVVDAGIIEQPEIGLGDIEPVASSGDFIDTITPNTKSKAGLPSENKCPPDGKLVSIISTNGYKMSACCPPDAPVGTEANKGGEMPVCCKEIKGKKGCPKESWPLRWPLKPVTCNEARGWGMFERTDEVNKDIGKSWGCQWCADQSKCRD
jgi:hypothetical protein